MLDFMRRHAQSWMIKVALGAVVVVFIFWGIWSPNEGRKQDLVKIGNYTISITEARNYYQNLRDRYQSVYGEKFTEEMAKKLNLKERAVKDLVNRVLLLQEAQHLGLKVSPEEVDVSIHANPAFQKDGLFDKATYLRALQRVRLTAPPESRRLSGHPLTRRGSQGIFFQTPGRVQNSPQSKNSLPPLRPQGLC
jgi:peptidyl-prolyl cis-trans isomerase D